MLLRSRVDRAALALVAAATALGTAGLLAAVHLLVLGWNLGYRVPMSLAAAGAVLWTLALAVTSTGAFIGNADEMNHRRREFEKTRGSMQQTGTRSAHLSMQSMTDREHRWI